MVCVPLPQPQVLVTRSRPTRLLTPPALFLCVVNRAVHSGGGTASSSAALFNLFATATVCPSAYHDGTLTECSTPLARLGQPGAPALRCADGACVCSPGYEPPYGMSPTAYEHAGFDRCAAQVTDTAALGPPSAPLLNYRAHMTQEVRVGEEGLGLVVRVAAFPTTRS